MKTPSRKPKLRPLEAVELTRIKGGAASLVGLDFGFMDYTDDLRKLRSGAST